MKCDKLKAIESSTAVIEAKDAEIAKIKQRYNDMDIAHTVHIAKMNAKIEELESNERRLKRALWLARAISAINAVGEIHNLIVCMRERNPKMSLSNTEAQEQVWKNVARKCRAKAEEYK